MQEGEEYSEAAEECRRQVVEDALATPLIPRSGCTLTPMHLDPHAAGQ